MVRRMRSVFKWVGFLNLNFKDTPPRIASPCYIRCFLISSTYLLAHQDRYVLHFVRASTDSTDLNIQPCEATYQILVNPYTNLSESIRRELEEGRVVHSSVEKVVVPSDTSLAEISSTNRGSAVAHSASETRDTGPNKTIDDSGACSTGSTSTSKVADPTDSSDHEENVDDENDNEREESSTDPTSIPNTRCPEKSDGILTPAQLLTLAQKLMPIRGQACRSAYGSTHWTDDVQDTFAGRSDDERNLRSQEMEVGLEGGGEGRYTCFSPLFRLTLGKCCACNRVRKY